VSPGKYVDRIQSRLVIVPCCARKTATTIPIAALDLYLDGPVPRLRERLGPYPPYRQRIRILSAQHGVVDADAPLLPYDRPLDEDRARQLRPQVARTLRHDADLGLSEALIVADSLYLTLVAGLLAMPACRIRWISDPVNGWNEAATVLDRWGWP
jgi:Family of unknown function (DUF6884)